METQILKHTNFPPIIGEYSYYDSRSQHHVCVNIKDKGIDNFGCSFSSKEIFPNIPFITMHGIITKITTKIMKNKDNKVQ
tara:strand:- start:1011 stop:1250 length:240 start_codon:yes stop_codon:yes gene_type:complete